MPLEEIAIRRDGATLHIGINRPAKRNALTSAMYAEMSAALAEAVADPEICSVIFSGTGAHFCAGNDLADFVANRPDGEETPVFRFLHAITHFPKIMIASVQGNAIGIGTTLLLNCDFVVAEADARLQMPFVDLALVPEAGSSLLLPRLVGHIRAAEFLLLGEPIPAERALSLGIVSRVEPSGQGLAAATVIADRLAAKPRAALLASKKLMRASSNDIDSRMAAENEAFRTQLQTPELHAVVAKFFATRSKAA